jgi:hypothetical protein
VVRSAPSPGQSHVAFVRTRQRIQSSCGPWVPALPRLKARVGRDTRSRVPGECSERLASGTRHRSRVYPRSALKSAQVGQARLAWTQRKKRAAQYCVGLYAIALPPSRAHMTRFTVSPGALAHRGSNDSSRQQRGEDRQIMATCREQHETMPDRVVKAQPPQEMKERAERVENAPDRDEP